MNMQNKSSNKFKVKMKINESTFKKILREESLRMMRENVETPSALAPPAAPPSQAKPPAAILNIRDSLAGVQGMIGAIQAAMNNPEDLIFKQKNPVTIAAYEGLKLVLAQSQPNFNIPYEEQLSDVRQAATDWISWAKADKTTMNPADKNTYDFFTAAATKLQAGQPIFSFAAEQPTTAKASSNSSQDSKWSKYLADDLKRAPVWGAWSAMRTNSGMTGPDDLSFDNFVMWWKDSKANKKFSDGNTGGVNATIAQLKAETAP